MCDYSVKRYAQTLELKRHLKSKGLWKRNYVISIDREKLTLTCKSWWRKLSINQEDYYCIEIDFLNCRDEVSRDFVLACSVAREWWLENK